MFGTASAFTARSPRRPIWEREAEEAAAAAPAPAALPAEGLPEALAEVVAAAPAAPARPRVGYVLQRVSDGLTLGQPGPLAAAQEACQRLNTAAQRRLWEPLPTVA